MPRAMMPLLLELELSGALLPLSLPKEGSRR